MVWRNLTHWRRFWWCDFFLNAIGKHHLLCDAFLSGVLLCCLRWAQSGLSLKDFRADVREMFLTDEWDEITTDCETSSCDIYLHVQSTHAYTHTRVSGQYELRATHDQRKPELYLLKNPLNKKKWMQMNCSVWADGWGETQKPPDLLVGPFYPIELTLINKKKSSEPLFFNGT